MPCVEGAKCGKGAMLGEGATCDEYDASSSWCVTKGLHDKATRDEEQHEVKG